MEPPNCKILLLVALFFLLSGQCESSFLRKARTHVQIRNDLAGGVDLTVHCRSKDNDLGVHVVPPGGSYGFRFRPNIICTTLFWCSFEWPGVSRGFRIYECFRDYDRCFDCTWSIRSDQPCLFNWKTEQYDLCDKW